MGQYISLSGADSIPVLVTIDGVDRIGELEAWRQGDDGNWSGYVKWVGPINDGRYQGLHVGWFPAADIKRDEQPGDDHANAGDA